MLLNIHRYYEHIVHHEMHKYFDHHRPTCEIESIEWTYETYDSHETVFNRRFIIGVMHE